MHLLPFSDIIYGSRVGFASSPFLGSISPLLVLLLVPLGAIGFIIAKAPARRTAGVAAALNLVLSLGLLGFYPAAQGGYAYTMDYAWVTLQGLPPIRFHLGADGISLPLVCLTAIVTFAAIAISPGNIRRSSEYYCYLLLMSLGAMGAFVSLDVFFFYIFHEFALIPTFLLIGIWGAQKRQFASFQVTIYLMAGSLILLAGLVALIMALPPPERTFDIVRLQAYLEQHPIAVASQDVIFPLLLVGFGILVGLFPFHSWARGYASAPPAAAMLHAGILKKFAIYGMIRIAIPMLHDGFTDWTPVILILLTGNFLYGGFVTIAQKELPTMIGFSSIMHMGYLFLGVVCLEYHRRQRRRHPDGRARTLRGAPFRPERRNHPSLGREPLCRAGRPRAARAGARRALHLRLDGLDGRAGTGQLRGRADGLLRLLFGVPGRTAVVAVAGTVITAIFQLRAIKDIFYGPMPGRYSPTPIPHPQPSPKPSRAPA